MVHLRKGQIREWNDPLNADGARESPLPVLTPIFFDFFPYSRRLELANPRELLAPLYKYEQNNIGVALQLESFIEGFYRIIEKCNLVYGL